MKKYLLGIFVLCFFVWAVVVDNLMVPAGDQLRQDVGTYTRYRVKRWQQGGKLDIIPNELMIYAVVKNREQVYYMEYKYFFENSLKNLPEGTPVQLRYAARFPKFWRRHLYDLRINGISKLGYNAYQLTQKQRAVWKFTGMMGGIFLMLAALGWIARPRRR